MCVRSELSDIPESIKTEVRRIHHDLGKSEQHLKYIRYFVCPACTYRQPPGHPPKGSARAKPSCFNQLDVLDLKFARDFNGEEHVFLNCLDVATLYSMFVRVKDRRGS
eukprot:3480490-Amphidinium_carterae.6